MADVSPLTRVAGEFEVNANWQNYQRSPIAYSLAGGGYVVCWNQGDQYSQDTYPHDPVFRFFDANGSPLTADLGAPYPQVVYLPLSNGNFAIVHDEPTYTGIQDIRVLIYSSTGQVL